ncbi:hypothetical protein PPYR_03691 [Photinus pyralis]|uniref:Uncharacterized protein n=2 Tax=Photinus pyralis TaxID=7054 RepID=A0A5N4A3L3_PHOPY|nr:uncharacterized protein LOC116161841 [Photinus pyralis]KAB0791891.1 hypothetical protein PPYR_03691 [Photinus pyralis]
MHFELSIIINLTELLGNYKYIWVSNDKISSCIFTMYIKTLFVTLFFAYAVAEKLKCYKCDSSNGHPNCQSGSGIGHVTCEEPPADAGITCLAYSENVNGVTKYVRDCAIVGGTFDYQAIPLCPSMRERGRDIRTCTTCATNDCNGTPL